MEGDITTGEMLRNLRKHKKINNILNSALHNKHRMVLSEDKHVKYPLIEYHIPWQDHKP